MSSKRKTAGAAKEACSSEEDEAGRENVRRKYVKKRATAKIEQTFRIHYSELLTSYDRDERRTAAVTLVLDVDTSEGEIRNILILKLPQLRGKTFTFFTKDKEGNRYHCPCSLKCEAKDHLPAEWNARNIGRAARSNRAVYILIKNANETHCSSGYEATSTENRRVALPAHPTFHFQRNEEANAMNEREPFFHPSQAVIGATRNTAPPSNPMQLAGNSLEDKEFLNHLEMTDVCLTDEQIASLVDNVQLQDNIDNMKRREVHNEADEEEVTEVIERGDNGDVDVDVADIFNERQYQNLAVSPFSRGIRDARTRLTLTDSAYETLQTGSTTTIFPQDCARQSQQLDLPSPLGVNTSTDTLRNQARGATVTLVKLVEITPEEGSVEGGYSFYLRFDPSSSHDHERYLNGQLSVMFGEIPPVPAEKVSNNLLTGIVPGSPTHGSVQVKMLSASGETISDTVTFLYTKGKKHYTEERRKKIRSHLDGEINSSEDGLEYLSLLLEKMKEMDLNSKGGSSANGKEKTRALSLLRMIVETAAKINAIKFFTIIFSTPVGRNVFKSFKDEELSLEEVARENGHEELACYLEERHLMYQDIENDSDDEVDWEALAKAAKDYQRREVGRDIISSTSSEGSHGYSGDTEDCLSVFSERDRLIESFLEEEEISLEEKCQDETQTLLPERRTTDRLQSYCEDVEDGLTELEMACHPSEQLEVQEETSDSQHQEQARQTLSKGCFFQSDNLPDVRHPLVGRDSECETIIDNFALENLRIGVISGPLGIGKTSVAVEVGNKLLSRDWIVHYHDYTSKDPNSDIVMFLKTYCPVSSVESDITEDATSKTSPAQQKNPTLLILDQLETVLEADKLDIIPNGVQRLVDAALEKAHDLHLLLVSRRKIDFMEDFAFSIQLEPLRSAVAVQLLQSVSPISSNADLEVIANGCGFNPFAITIVLALIQKGISENDIINKMSSPDIFWKKLSHNVVKNHFLKESETSINGHPTKLVQKESFKPLLSSLKGIHSSERKQLILDSWIQETKYNEQDEYRDEISVYDKASDPRYCHCRLCTSSDGISPFKLALESSAFSYHLSIEDLNGMIGNDASLQNEKGELMNCEFQGKDKETHFLALLIRGLLRGSLMKDPFHSLKEALKKTKEHVPRFCSCKSLPKSNSHAGSIAQTSEREQPSRETGQTEQAEGAGKEDLSRTCMKNTLPELDLSPNEGEDIVSAPFNPEKLTIREKKKTRLVEGQKSSRFPKRQRIKTLLRIAVPSCFCLFALVLLFYFTLEHQTVYVATPEVTQRTAIALKALEVNSSRIANGNSSDVYRTQIAPTGICSADQYTIIIDSKELNCVRCPRCPPGQRLSVPCGSHIGDDTIISCLPCEFGVTYSDHDSYSCKKCSQCASNETVVRACTTFADVVCLRCESNQITLISSTKGSYQCVDCPLCPTGLEPSHPCGSIVQYGELIMCVPCREGETFSTKADRRQCKPCSSCPPSQRLIARCTKYFDTICGRISSTICRGHEIQIGLSNNTNVTCINCLMCPPGMESSVSCGAIVMMPHTELFCRYCSPGLTFSDMHNVYGCRPCSLCPLGAVVISKCSPTRDTVCSTIKKCLPSQMNIINGHTITCVGCVKCSVGMEPSIQCGSTSTSLSRQQCNSCKPGTFSDSYGSEPCKPCRHCKKGVMVKQYCSSISNTVCSSCEPRYYFSDFFMFCVPCSMCCNDGKDLYPRECANEKVKKCNVGKCTPNSKVFSIDLDNSAKMTIAATTAIATKPETSLLLVTGIAFFILTAFFTLLLLYRRLRGRKLVKTFSEAWTSERWQCLAGEITLEELDAGHMEIFEWMCRTLDKRPRDYKRLAMMYDRIPLEERGNLQNELKSPGGSPTKRLVSLIQELYPSATLGDFITALREIGRHDIAERIIPWVLRRAGRTARRTAHSIEEQFL